MTPVDRVARVCFSIFLPGSRPTENSCTPSPLSCDGSFFFLTPSRGKPCPRLWRVMRSFSLEGRSTHFSFPTACAPSQRIDRPLLYYCPHFSQVNHHSPFSRPPRPPNHRFFSLGGCTRLPTPFFFLLFFCAKHKFQRAASG